MLSPARRLALSARVAAQYARTFAAVAQVRQTLVPDTLDDLAAEDWEDDDWEEPQQRQRDRLAALGRLAKLVDAFALGSITLRQLGSRTRTETAPPGAARAPGAHPAGLTDADTSAVGDVLERMRAIADQRRAGDISAEQAASWLRREAGALHQHWQQEQLVEANDRPEAVYFVSVRDVAAQSCDDCIDLDGEVRPSEAWEGDVPGQRSCGTSCRCELEPTDAP